MVGGGLGTVLSTTAPICSTKRPSRKIASILHSLLDCNLPQMYASERNGNIPHMIFVSLFFTQEGFCYQNFVTQKCVNHDKSA